MLTNEERKKYIGSSDAAAVLGLSRWDSPLSVWVRKVYPELVEPEETLQQWLGTKMEDIVAQRFMKETSLKVRRVNDHIIHKKYGFLSCQIDRKVEGENTILECKTATAFKSAEWAEDEIPPEYLIQVYHQLACTGWSKAVIACLIGNHKFIINEIERTEEVEQAIQEMIKREVYFWREYVEKEVMPAVSARDDKILFKLFPQAIEGDPIPLDDKANILIENLEALKTDKKSIEIQIKQKNNELKAMLKDAEVGETSLYRVTWRNVKTEEYIVPEKEYRRLHYEEIKNG